LSRELPDSAFEPPRLGLRYLGQRDQPWLSALLDEHARFFGRKRCELRERLREPFALRAPKNKLRLAIQLLERLVPDVEKTRLLPREVRARVFAAASRLEVPRAAVLAQVACELGATVDELEAGLLSDLAGERRVGRLPEELSAAHLAISINHALVLQLLKRATMVRIRASEDAGALVRHARLLGLICNVSRGDGAEALQLDISGPLALFRKTALYGRALASLLPRAASCQSFELEATCSATRGQIASTFVVRAGDPIFPTRDLPVEKRRLDARFARDFTRARSDWQLLTEPKPVEAAGTVLFPDFELAHRQRPERRFLLEILGFWTHRHVAEKLRSYRAAGQSRVILCVDERRRCNEAELPPMAPIVPYKDRVDVKQVLARLEAWIDG
jgi:predicted nuclease of restriction endonuclease-like RecB superfamily